ncbi:MAG: class I SAM-dependent methyltransferase [Candidatus Moranbacteria bacterium]|nr:class I SAM-dependent methyltransferase [Candidatus Moranbacteria bacterium]
MEQRVDPSTYDECYYAGRYQNIDYQNLKRLSEFDHIYQKAGSMLQLEERDRIVDFGCGAGHMSFYLYLKYKCDITGVDYSRDAIFLCEKNLTTLEGRSGHSVIRERVRFIFSDGDNLPDFEGVRAVFLIDVVEHLYDHELDSILSKIRKWSGEKEIKIIVHTDNNYYLKFIRPITDLLAVCFGKATFQKIKKVKVEEAKGHINLTTASKLKRKLISHNFNILKIEYPSMDIAITKNQLGPIAKYRIILYPIFYVGKIFYFLRPSFYMLAKHRNSI